VPFFLAPPGKATVTIVADHVEHIAKVVGKRQWVRSSGYTIFFSLTVCASVGIGSDYDGIEDGPIGLEDVSTFPTLVSRTTRYFYVTYIDDLLHQIAELYSRGWTETELAGLACNNFLRVFEGAERVARNMKAMGVEAAFDLYDKRPDLPVRRSIAEVLDSFKKQDK
jgi:membrane dipeptidase